MVLKAQSTTEDYITERESERERARERERERERENGRQRIIKKAKAAKPSLINSRRKNKIRIKKKIATDTVEECTGGINGRNDSERARATRGQSSDQSVI